MGSLLAKYSSVPLFEAMRSVFNDKLMGYISSVEENVLQLRTQFQDFYQIINELEQYRLSSVLEIHGLRSAVMLPINGILQKLAEALRIQISETDIERAYRVQNYVSGKPPIIVVEFSSKIIRDQWIRKSQSKILECAKIFPGYGSSRIVCIERLTDMNRMLYQEISERAKDIGYRYVFVQNGKIFIKKRVQDIPFQVQSRGDIPVIVTGSSSDSDYE